MTATQPADPAQHGAADALLHRLSLRQKAQLCLGSDIWHTAALPEIGIRPVTISDGPHGLRKQPDEGDVVGVALSSPATCFPTASALGSAWNPQLALEIGQAVGAEARELEVAVVLGPGINIKRSPLCGRNFEYFSEDPYLSGVLGAAVVTGIQSRGVGAALKHFAANNQETDRFRVSVDVDERTLREIYLRAFEYVVREAHPWVVMSSYNKINGVSSSQNRWLLTTVLREEWGFGGLVVSDWGGTYDIVAAVRAGLDLEMPPKLGIDDLLLVEAVDDGRLDEAALDRAAGAVLALLDRHAQPSVIADVDYEAHHRLARRAATQCAVLLKNERSVLPLAPVPGSAIAVIGALGADPRFQGAGSSRVRPTWVDSPLREIQRVAGPQVRVHYEPGYPLDDDTDPGATATLVGAAVDLARRADHVVVFLGLPDAAESEGYDRTDMSLPPQQVALIRAVAAVRSDVIVVLSNGSAVELASWDQSTAAILEMWLGGQAVGGAVADLLLGRETPGGRLAETLPLKLEDVPSFPHFPGEDGHVVYGERMFVGYRGFDIRSQPVSYPFGHGLTYTTFGYDELHIAEAGPGQGTSAFSVRCAVTNTGSRAGSEVVQLYVGPRSGLPLRPVRQLRGFARLNLAAGDSGVAEFTLTRDDFAHWSTRHGQWVVEAGDYEISVGRSSRDLRLRASVTVAADAPARTLDESCTLGEWLADADGRRLLHELVQRDETGRHVGILGNDELRRMVLDYPLATIPPFPGAGITFEVVDQAVRSLTGQSR